MAGGFRLEVSENHVLTKIHQKETLSATLKTFEAWRSRSEFARLASVNDVIHS